MYEDATAVPAGETAARAAVRTSGTSTDPQRQKGSTSGRLVPQQVGQQWICAAKDGYMPLLQSLYQQHPELLNHQPAAGLRCSALHWAAARGHADALQQLLLWGADPCLLTSTGSSCLHSAAAADRQECVKLLLRTPQVLQHLDHTNEDGLTAAALAGKHGHKVVQGLLQTAAASGGRPAAVAGAVSSTHQQVPDVPAAATAASGVAKQQRAGTGLRSGFFNKPQSTRAPPKHQPSGAPANAAAAAGHVAVSNAHKHSKPPSATEATCSSSHSSQSDSQAAVTSSIGRSWLDAARRGDLAAMEQLLSQHPQLMQYNGTGTSYAFTGNSALHWSAAKGYTHVVLWLLQHGADVQQVNEAGESALHTAVGHRQVACAQALVMQGGADMHMQDGLGQSPAEVRGSKLESSCTICCSVGGMQIYYYGGCPCISSVVHPARLSNANQMCGLVGCCSRAHSQPQAAESCVLSAFTQVAGAAGGQSLVTQLLQWDLARTLTTLDR
eukprot:GHUV01041758.1.p1 GENE.GHUV01041758.1~~GHUV01041758.1.p1  ORF type:complete len:536 (+),score=182.93 GHUV01041758.1:117-1610(+)